MSIPHIENGIGESMETGTAGAARGTLLNRWHWWHAFTKAAIFSHGGPVVSLSQNLVCESFSLYVIPSYAFVHFPHAVHCFVIINAFEDRGVKVAAIHGIILEEEFGRLCSELPGHGVLCWQGSVAEVSDIWGHPVVLVKCHVKLLFLFDGWMRSDGKYTGPSASVYSPSKSLDRLSAMELSSRSI